MDTIPIQREPQEGQVGTNMASGEKVGRNQAQHLLEPLETSQILTARGPGHPSSTWL